MVLASSGSAPSTGRDTTARLSSGEREKLKPLRILIVEDEPLIAWALADMVGGLGYEVCATVASEAAAVEEAHRLVPDAILMDFRLAGGAADWLRRGGFARCRACRSSSLHGLCRRIGPAGRYAGSTGFRPDRQAGVADDVAARAGKGAQPRLIRLSSSRYACPSGGAAGRHERRRQPATYE